MTDIEVDLDEGRQRFFARLESGEAYVQFDRIQPDVLDLTSTFVPEPHRERGIGEKLVIEALEYARENDLDIVPTCPFVEYVLDRNPEYRTLVADR